MSAGSMQARSDPLRPLKLMTVVNLVLLSVQAYTGDAVNLFGAFPAGAVSSFGQFFSSLLSAGPGPLALWHGVAGLLVVLLSIGIAVSAFRRTKSRSLRIVSLLALLSVASAAVGGYLFVFSGYLNNAYSSQMGGSFIAAYAMNFLALYYSK